MLGAYGGSRSRSSKAQSCAEDTVVICGLGTIGLLLLMFLLDARTKAGACSGKVLAVGNKESQREMAWKIGLSKDSYCDGSKEDAVRWIMERTEGQGADAFLSVLAGMRR